MPRTHRYDLTVTWTGAGATGTTGYRDYSRDHDVTAEGPAPIAASSDPALAGDRTRWNPEQLLTASLSQCHMLWYLHLCAEAGVVVLGYTDEPHGQMEEHRGGGNFTEVLLRPRVTVASADMVEAGTELHEDAHDHCFIANSVNFPVRCEPVVAAH